MHRRPSVIATDLEKCARRSLLWAESCSRMPWFRIVAKVATVSSSIGAAWSGILLAISPRVQQALLHTRITS